MKRFEHVTSRERGPGGSDMVGSLLVQAGVPTRAEGLVPLSYGIKQGEPVVVISQRTGDARASQSSMLQAIRPADARALAALLLAAAAHAEDVDPKGAPELPDVATMSLEDLRAEVEGGREAYAHLAAALAARVNRW